MGEAKGLADALRRAWEGEAWHGPSLGALLGGWSGEQAAAHPVPGAHSAWELLAHLTTWTEVPRRRLLGESPAVDPKRNWPPAEAADDEAWREAVARLRRAHRDLVRAVERLDDGDLDNLGGDGASLRETFYGVLQHHAYHGGQLAMLRRAIAERAEALR